MDLFPLKRQRLHDPPLGSKRVQKTEKKSSVAPWQTLIPSLLTLCRSFLPVVDKQTFLATCRKWYNQYRMVHVKAYSAKWIEEFFANLVLYHRRGFLEFTDSCENTHFKIVFQKHSWDRPYRMIVNLVVLAGDMKILRTSSSIFKLMNDYLFTFSLSYARNSETSFTYSSQVQIWDKNTQDPMKEFGCVYQVLDQLMTELSESNLVSICQMKFWSY
jgi:hypothetical protein